MNSEYSFQASSAYTPKKVSLFLTVDFWVCVEFSSKPFNLCYPSLLFSSWFCYSVLGTMFHLFFD